MPVLKPALLDWPAATRATMDVEAGETWPDYGCEYRRRIQPGDAHRWLGNTPLLQLDDPKLRILSLRLTQLKSGDREKALVCYQFVRALPFACAAAPGSTSSVDVLSSNAGDCFTKSTLLVALLRSLRIPARVRMLQIGPLHLWGIVHTGGKPIEHAVTEVLLGDTWLAVDSYVVDLRLGLISRSRLLREKRKAGYGVHMKGQVTWNATDSSFSHFNIDHPASMPSHDFGCFDDVAQFWDTAGLEFKPGWARQQHMAILAVLANKRIRRLRCAPACP